MSRYHEWAILCSKSGGSFMHHKEMAIEVAFVASVVSYQVLRFTTFPTGLPQYKE